ncbi:MAG: hypothetical protein ABIZ70_09730 [Gemmatimonadales bacterium]
MSNFHAVTGRRLAALIALAIVAAPLSAQSASITATATVFRPITISGARNLDFANVFPGVNKSVAVSAATSGRFDIVAEASQAVSLTFALPTTLASGVNSLAIGSWNGCWNATNSTTGCTTFTPSASASNATVGGATNLYVFVGATVLPTAAQVAGAYTGTVSLTVAYF